MQCSKQHFDCGDSLSGRFQVPNTPGCALRHRTRSAICCTWDHNREGVSFLPPNGLFRGTLRSVAREKKGGTGEILYLVPFSVRGRGRGRLALWAVGGASRRLRLTIFYGYSNKNKRSYRVHSTAPAAAMTPALGHLRKRKRRAHRLLFAAHDMLVTKNFFINC